MNKQEQAKKKLNSAVKGQLPGIKKYSSLKDAFKDVEKTVGELHLQAVQKGRR